MTVETAKQGNTDNPFAPLIGTTLGQSASLEVTQDRITAFGGVTLDFDPYHIDPAQAANGPFGQAAAQGFLTLSLLTHFITTLPAELAIKEHVNYGLNRVRFTKPVPVGEDLQATFVLQDAQERSPGLYLLTLRVDVALRRSASLAMTAEWLVLVRT